MEKFFLHGFIAFLLIIGLIAWHAFIDANSKRIEAEERFNNLPRIRPVKRKLKWPGRLLSFISLQSFR